PLQAALPAAEDLHLLGDHRAHVGASRRRLAQGPLGERKELLPAVDGLFLTVGRPVVIEDPVASAVVAMELVLLSVLLELRLVLIDLFGRRRLVLVAEEA